MSELFETTYDQAASWWPDIRRQLTFLSWKDHFWKFTHLWNGGLIVSATDRILADREVVSRQRANFCQMAFGWSARSEIAPVFRGYAPGVDPACRGGIVASQPGQFQCPLDDGEIPQRLYRGYLPLVETDHAVAGAVVRQTSFAAMPAGMSVRSGLESLFALLHFEVVEPKPGQTAYLWVQVSPPHHAFSMQGGTMFRYPADRFPRVMNFHPGKGLADDGRIFLSTLPGEDAEATFLADVPPEAPGWDSNRSLGYACNLLRFPVRLDSGRGLTLLVPFGGCRSLRLLRPLLREGYAAAFDRVAAFWAKETSRGAQIVTPDPEINRFYRYNLALSAIQCEMRPELGSRIIETSVNHYEAYWATPGSFSFVEFAQRGLFQDASEWLEHFRRDQGRNTPPGERYPYAEGFLTSPAPYAPMPMRWITDHGAILWAACETYLLSRDRAFLRRWLPAIRKACQWIAESRRFDSRGLLPPGRASDSHEHAYHPWTDGWNYRGLLAAIQLFEAAGHKAEAARWLKEARAWRSAFRAALAESIAAYPRWKTPQGDEVPFVPFRLNRFGPLKPEEEAAASEDYKKQVEHGFYLDCGPLTAVEMGLLDPRDEAIDWAFRFYLEGPNQATYRDTGHPRMCFQPPVLRHEMSSCEPCYSWNVPARLFRDEIPEFLEGFYSILAGAQPRKTLGIQETRHGIHGLPCAGGFLLILLRRMIAWERPGNVLRLLEAVPRRWLGPGQSLEVSGLPTHFGPLSLRARGEKGVLLIDLRLERRPSAGLVTLRLRLPGDAQPSSVRVNGRKKAVRDGRIALPRHPDQQTIEVLYP